jgi:2-aminoadipate transaminase
MVGSGAEPSGSLLRSLISTAASRGRSGYLDLPEVPVAWAFEAGLPDPATFPIDALTRISADVLRDDSADALQYGGGYHGSVVYGWEGLRRVLAERTRERDGREVGLREVMLTSGGVQALTAVCHAFLDPGDSFAVEAPTWDAILHAASTTGALPVAIPLDEDGMRIDVLEERLAELAERGKPLKLVYTIDTFHTPTGACLSLKRRRRLIELAREWSFVILEDNVYGDLRYSGDPVPSMFSLDDTGLVIKVDSFSKTLAPALRIGWVTGHADAIAALSAVRGDLGVSQWIARVVEAFLREGLYEPHLAKVNALYRRKRDVAIAALREHCAEWLTWNEPDGGFFLWLEANDAVDGRQVLKHAIAKGVVCRPGERFFGDADAGRQFFRLAFVTVPEEEIARGIAVLGDALRASLLTDPGSGDKR